MCQLKQWVKKKKQPESQTQSITICCSLTMARIPWPGILHSCGEGAKVRCNKGRIFKGRLLGVFQKLDVERGTKSFRGWWVGTGCNAALYMCTDPRLSAAQKRKSEENSQSWSLEARRFTQPCKFYIIGASADIWYNLQQHTASGQWMQPRCGVTLKKCYHRMGFHWMPHCVSRCSIHQTHLVGWNSCLASLLFFFFFSVRKSIIPKEDCCSSKSSMITPTPPITTANPVFSHTA